MTDGGTIATSLAPHMQHPSLGDVLVFEEYVQSYEMNYC